jgi:hypothetical protein
MAPIRIANNGSVTVPFWAIALALGGVPTLTGTWGATYGAQQTSADIARLEGKLELLTEKQRTLDQKIEQVVMLISRFPPQSYAPVPMPLPAPVPLLVDPNRGP